MPTFPLRLSALSHVSTHAIPVVEEASPTSCTARATFRPKNIRYEAVTELRGGRWSITTYEDGRALTGSGTEDYPVARGYQIGLIVINWWNQHFAPADLPALPMDLASARATWLSRAAHKLLTDVPDRADQLAALRMLASDYGITSMETARFPSTKAAGWTASASQTLERALPEESRPVAVAVLVEMITGIRSFSQAASEPVSSAVR